jgi:hypothetical protein
MDEKGLRQLNSTITQFRSHTASATWNEDLDTAKKVLNQLARQ